MNYPIRYGEGVQVVPLLAVEATANDHSYYVHCKNAHHVTFLVGVGTCDTATTITVLEASSAATTSAQAIPFHYRLSGACSAGSDTWSAVTSCDSTGFALTATTDNGKFILIDIDPSDLTDGDHYLYVKTAATAYSTAGALTCVAFLEGSRYSQLNPMSST